MSSVTAIACLCLFGLVVHSLFQRYQPGLINIPGPFWASLSNLYRFRLVWIDDVSDRSLQLHKRYGPLLRMGPKYISASSPECVHTIYRSGTGFQKAETYSLLQPKMDGEDLHNLFSTQDKALHATVKRNIGALFSQNSIRGCEPHIDSTIFLLLERLRSMMADTGRVQIDASAWMQFWAFDTIGEIIFSQKFGFIATGTDIGGFCAQNHENMTYFGLMGQMPRMEKIWSRLVTLTKRRQPSPLFKLALDAIEERERLPRRSTDMLDAFISMHDKRPDGFTRRDMIAASYISLVTAHDVLAISLRAVLYHLAKKPAVRKKVRAEIREADLAGKLSPLAQQSETLDLAYVNAVIIEALRIHPSTGLMFERYVPEGGVHLHGKFIPAGTTIGVNAWVFNRDTAIFGEDSDVFRPERWIECSPERSKEMKKWMFTFSAGSRACIGKHLAMMEITKLIVELYRNFDIELPDPDHEWDVGGNWLTTQTNMDMVFKQGVLSV